VVKTIGLPCSGKMDLPYLVKAFETGADSVVILSCKENECRHLEGTVRAHKRAEAVESLLGETGLGGGRITVLEWDKNGLEEVLASIKDFLEKVRRLPQLPAQSIDQKERVAA
jgi:F420-non-reducing hydrogenase iron-sulfur subunit